MSQSSLFLNSSNENHVECRKPQYTTAEEMKCQTEAIGTLKDEKSEVDWHLAF